MVLGGLLIQAADPLWYVHMIVVDLWCNFNCKYNIIISMLL